MSSNGKWLVTGGIRKVAVWPMGEEGIKAKPRVLDCHDCPLLSKVAISPEGQWIGAVGDTATAVPLWYSFLSNWEGDPGEHYVVRGHSSGLNDLAFSPDNRWLVTAGRDKTARLWDLKSLDVAESGTVLSGHEAGVNSVAFSPDSRWILTGSDDSTAHLWRLDAQGLERATPERISVEGGRTQSVSADGRLLTIKMSEDLITLDLTTSDPTLTTPTRMAAEWSAAHVCMSPDGQWLVAADRNAFGSNAILWKLLPVSSDIKPVVLRGHKDNINACQISADNHWVATASDDGTARLWDLTGPTPGQTSFVLSGHSDVLHTLAFDPGSRFLVTGSRDRTARRWNLKAQNPADSSTIVANDGQGVDSSITAVALSDNAQRLVTGDYSGLVRVWNLANGAAPITLRGHRQEIVGAAISSDGQFVVTGSEDSTIRIWNLRPEASGVPIVHSSAGRRATALLIPKQGWPLYCFGQ